MWVTPNQVSTIGVPAACTSLPAIVLAPVTETCCPIRARVASSKPSAVPGTLIPGQSSHKWAEHRIFRQSFVYRDRVGIEIAQVSASCDRGRQVTEVLESEHSVDVSVLRCKRDDTFSVRQAQRSRVGTAFERFDAGDRA